MIFSTILDWKLQADGYPGEVTGLFSCLSEPFFLWLFIVFFMFLHGFSWLFGRKKGSAALKLSRIEQEDRRQHPRDL